MSRLSKKFILGVMTVLVLSLVLPGQQMKSKLTKTFGLKPVVSLKVLAPANYQGACPHTFTFEGTIIFKGLSSFSYYFKRSDGVSTRPRNLLMAKKGKLIKTLTWKINKSYSGWVEFHVTLNSKKMVSNRAKFSIRCRALVGPAKRKLTLIKPVVPIRVRGGVSIVVRPSRTLLLPSIRLYKSGNPLPGQKVVVDSSTIPEQSKGHYRKEIPGYSPSAGKIVSVKIGPGLRTLSPVTKPYKIAASAKTGNLVSFSTPAANATIKLSKITALAVAWNPRRSSVNIVIYHLIGKTAGAKVFEKQNVGGGHILVPAKVFSANKQYGIYLSHTMGNFSIKGHVAPGSKLILRQSVGTYIYTR